MIDDDPALYMSEFERTPKDRYWTDAWVTAALLEMYDIPEKVWEPAAGRGDMVRVLVDHGHDVIASDIDMSEFDPSLCECSQDDFLTAKLIPRYIDAVVTNPPYNLAQKFVEHSLELQIPVIAMLLRSEFKHAKRRKHLFGRCSRYLGEIVLTSRPRWDWWFRIKPEASPRHNFSWFIWDNIPDSTQLQRFHYREDKK